MAIIKSIFKGEFLRRQGRGVKVYHNGILRQQGSKPEEVDAIDGIITYDIHNDTPAKMLDISVEAEYPILRVEGPAEIPAGAWAKIQIYMDTEAAMWLPNSTVTDCIKYSLLRVVGADDEK